MSRGSLLPLALALLMPAALRAQLRAQVDIGLRGAPVAGFGTRSLWSVAPTLRYDDSRLRLDASGEFRDYGRLGRGVSGSVNGNYLVPLDRRLFVEATAALRGQDGGPLVPASLWEAGGRLHLAGDRAGGWLGSQAGHDGNGRTLRWEAAAWRRLGNVTIQVQGSQLSLNGLVRGSETTPDTLNPDTLARGQAQVQTDLGAWLHWAGERVQLVMAVGRRYGATEVAAAFGVPDGGLGGAGPTSSRSTQHNTTWWLADATYWVTPRWGVTASVGERPPDSQLQTPGGRFVQVALRASLGSGPRATPAPSAGNNGRRDLRTRRVGAELVELQLLAPEAELVEVRGDFTDWRPLELERMAGGHWRLRLPIAPGLHSLAVRYDGGAWEPPPGARVEIDEFGQPTGVLVIE